MKAVGMRPGGVGSPSRGFVVLALALSAWLSSSCAYYNTYYLARRYYTTATAGLPYAVEKPTGAQAGNYQKTIDYSKKVIASYPKSKWVDDAYLMWAQALLGKEDPLQSINMLLDFHGRFPDSPRSADATFYLGVAYRQARKPREALIALDEFLEKAPKNELVPYAYLERSRALMSLERPVEAAQAASQIVERFPKSPLVLRARAARAEALLAGGDPLAARQDFQELGLRAADDDARFAFLLREVDCLEAAHDYTTGLQLLTTALSHEPAPVKTPSGAAPTGPGADRYGQLTLRVGTMHLLAGRSDQALASYRNVLQDYPKTALAAEAQYRIAYTYETALDDFTIARQEYAKVRDQSVGSAFFAQATDRQQSLDRLERFRSAGSDSAGRAVEAGFLLAEQYLFQLDKPERALEAYADIVREHPGTPAAGKALNAQAWVLRRKLERPAAADSLLWTVVHEYPATEAQLAARDYLEAEGRTVPAELIKVPEQTGAPPDTAAPLTAPPEGPMPLGHPARTGLPGLPGIVPHPDSLADGSRGLRVGPGSIVADSTRRGAEAPAAPSLPSVSSAIDTLVPPRVPAGKPVPADTLARPRVPAGMPAPADTLARPRAPAGKPAPGDTLARPRGPAGKPAPGDSLARLRATAGKPAPGDTLARPRGPAGRPSPADSLGRGKPAPARTDSTARRPAPARADTSARVRPDSTRVRPAPAPARPDTVWAPR